MARQKKWSSEAERQAAYRQRKTGTTPEPPDDQDPLDPGERELLAATVKRGSEIPERVHTSSLPALPKDRPAPPAEEYVAAAGRDARKAAEGRKYPNDEWIASVLAAAERYARWRHAGYVAGEIKSL